MGPLSRSLGFILQENASKGYKEDGTRSDLDIRKAILVTKLLGWMEMKTDLEQGSEGSGIRPSGS